MNANPLALFWEGFTIESYAQIDAQSLLIRLQPADDYLPCCSGCNQHTLAIHDISTRRVRERDLFQYRVWLDVPVRRVRCTTCGPKLEQIRWLPGRQRLTAGMVSWIESLVRLMPIQHVATLLGLHWHTVKAIDHRRLKGYVDGIIASAVYRLNTSVLEGMNNKIKVIKRVAYGYRDNDYFFLKIKAAFPSKAR